MTAKIHRRLLRNIFFVLAFVPLIISATAIPLTSITIPLATNENHTSALLGTDQKITSLLAMINETMLQTYMETLLSYGPRLTSSYGCKKAAAFIYDQFTAGHLETRYQNWTALGNRWHPGRFNSQNVEATLKGKTDKILLFVAHYDTVESTLGADDNGAGTVALLAAAAVLSHFSFNHTLKFLAVSGEEEGLLGSRAYAKEAYGNDDDIVAVFNADMIGHAVTTAGGRQFRASSTADIQYILDIIEQLNSLYDFSFTITRGITNEEGKGGSDYFSFVEYGFETVAFFEKEWNTEMHQPGDTIQNINFSYLANTTRFIIAAMAYLADRQISNPQVRMMAPRFGTTYIKGAEKPALRDLHTTIISNFWVWTEVKPGDAPIQRVEFYYDNTLAFVDTEPPYVWHMNKFSLREHMITVVVYDQLGRTAHDWKNIRYLQLIVKQG